MLRIALLLFLFIISCSPIALLAHGDLHERIASLTEQIKNHPDSAYLFMKRGELYFQHEEPNKSLADFEKCARMGYKDIRLDYNLAKNHFELKDHQKAIQFLSDIIQKDENYVKAYRVLGNVYFDLARYKEAATSFQKVLEIADAVLPENYMETSVAWQREGGKEGMQKAVQVIYDGIDALGELFTFYNRLEALENLRNNLPGVIEVQTKIIEQSNRKENALYNRGLTYLKMNKRELAIQDFEAAKSAILKLNMRIRIRKATEDLLSSIEHELKLK